MKNIYRDKEITKEILDSIKVGDKVRCNDWERAKEVVGVSPNYFVMATRCFGKWLYSVCEKKPFKGIRYNVLVDGYFSIGTDNYVFGFPNYNAYEFDSYSFISKYLKAFEGGECELSMRKSCELTEIEVRRST